MLKKVGGFRELIAWLSDDLCHKLKKTENIFREMFKFFGRKCRSPNV